MLYLAHAYAYEAENSFLGVIFYCEQEIEFGFFRNQIWDPPFSSFEMCHIFYQFDTAQLGKFIRL